MLYGIREGFEMDGAKPQKQQEKHHRQVPWTDTFVDELKSALLACRVLYASQHVLSIQMHGQLTLYRPLVSYSPYIGCV
jgi:POT family proton-dependent oligopeptide transporter